MTDLLPRLFIRDYRNTENPKVRAAYGTLSGIVGIILNLLLFAGKFIAASRRSPRTGIIRSDTRGSNISPR